MLESFDVTAQPSINAALVRELIAHGEYLLKKENVLLVGNPGTGKTHLATALPTELLFDVVRRAFCVSDLWRKSARIGCIQIWQRRPFLIRGYLTIAPEVGFNRRAMQTWCCGGRELMA